MFVAGGVLSNTWCIYQDLEMSLWSAWDVSAVPRVTTGGNGVQMKCATASSSSSMFMD